MLAVCFYVVLIIWLWGCALGICGEIPYGLDSRRPVGPFLNNRLPSAAGSSDGSLTVEVAFPNLTFEDPVAFLPEPRGERLFVCGRQGYIWSFIDTPAVSNKTLVLDLSRHTQGWEACGLLGLAFHPQWKDPQSPNRGYFYVWYQFSDEPLPGPDQPPPDTPGFNRLSRFTVPDGSLVADPNSEQVLIQQYDRHIWHNGGGLFFGTDGFLYVSTGDEGGLNDVYDSAQRLNQSLFSGVLRIDVDRDPTRSHPIRRQPLSGGSNAPVSYTTNYFIPNDNPFLDPAGGVLEEFWALGLRSPHRMTFDELTQTIWVGDVGQDRYEEISVIRKGGNYQWPFQEGFQEGVKPRPDSLTGIEQWPVYDYPHDSGDGCVIGGYVYRGNRFPELTGHYIFGDNGSGRIWALSSTGSNPPSVKIVCQLPGTSWTGLSSFGLDRSNEVYLCKLGSAGRIYRLARATVNSLPMPALLSQTGVFTRMSSLTPTMALIPYGVNVPFWSDGAEKLRWIAVPNDGAPYDSSERVGFSADGEWSFPDGTVFVKHFDLPDDETDPNSRKRLETRLLVRDTNGGVYGFTYKWRPDGSDADLLTNNLTEAVSIRTATGTRMQAWYYPSPQDCLVCHNENAGHVLGVKTRQLNGDFRYSITGRTDNQLRTWNHLGMLNPSLNEATPGGLPRLEPLSNPAASLELRARSYLDANCAHCHRPGGVVQAYFDARFDTPLASQGLVNGRLADTRGVPEAKVIVPVDPAHSMLHVRVSAVDSNLKMPPLARNVVDAPAVALLAEWINSLPPVQSLPDPWQHQDIGDVGFPGNAGYWNGIFTVNASGADIWDGADAFHYVFQEVDGDIELVAHLKQVSYTHPWAKAGLMIRETVEEGSPNFFVFAGAQQRTGIQFRDQPGGLTAYVEAPVFALPVWLKLTRNGSNLTGYVSTNGTNWATAGSRTMSWSNPVRVGLAVTAHNDAAVNTTTFDSVRFLSRSESPFRLTSVQRATNGWISFRLEGPTNSLCRVEASTYLTNWTAIHTQFTATGSFWFTNKTSLNSEQLFYRAVCDP